MVWEEDPEIISAACNVLRTLQELKSNPRTYNGSNLLRVNGPGMVIWRIRCTKQKSGYWSSVVYPKADCSSPLYSMKKVRSYLTTVHNIRPDDLPKATGGLQTEEDDDAVMQQVPCLMSVLTQLPHVLPPPPPSLSPPALTPRSSAPVPALARFCESEWEELVSAQLGHDHVLSFPHCFPSRKSLSSVFGTSAHCAGPSQVIFLQVSARFVPSDSMSTMFGRSNHF